MEKAKALAARGFKIFPIKAGAKYPPLWKDWPGRSSTTIPADWPQDCNVGIHCAGMVVVDVDPRNGGNESLLNLDLTTPGLPETLTANTPSGGTHFFYRLPDGHPGVANRAGVLGAGIDIKSSRGYVVGAGSRTAAGEYQWQNAAAPIAPAPQWLLDKLGRAPDVERAPAAPVPDADEATVARAQAWLDARPGAVEGQGGDAHTFATAAFLRDYGLSEHQTLTLMLGWNDHCSPPWGHSDLAAKVAHAYRYATGAAGAKAVTADDFPMVQESPVLVNLNESSAGADKLPTGPIRLGEFATRPMDGKGYLVKGLLNRGSYAEIYGDRGEGKTFVALDLAYHVAAGQPWMGRRVNQGPVLYLAYEGVGGLVQRAKALRQRYGTADVPFYVTAADYNLRDQTGRQAIGGVLAALPEKPALIVIDTFARALMGGDENSAQDVGAFNQSVAMLIKATGACVLILHHVGKDKTRGPRGSTALGGAIDTELLVDGGVLSPTKQRDIEMGDQMGFRLVPLVVGTDDEDEPITSCVVEPAAVRATPVDGRKLQGNCSAGWDVLCKLRPNNEPIGLDDWRDACREFLSARNLTRRFYDIKSRLESMQLIVVTNGMVTRRME